MSILVVCPNGHELKVRDTCAGKVGLCPTCRARVEVPETPQSEISEDAILGILGPHVASQKRAGSSQPRPPGGRERNVPPKKSCHHCNQEIPVGIHICPHCHTYIAKLGDF